jgi:DNA primase
MKPHQVRDYYSRLTEIDIGEVARDLLGGRITAESAGGLSIDCPHHSSQSRRSLQVRSDRRAWYCFGCGVGGDVLQLVEFVRSGKVTKGQTGEMPPSHREARDYLAARAGLPPLSKYGLSTEEISQIETNLHQESRIFSLLSELVSYYHARLRDSPKVLDWFRSKYAIGDETIDRLQIGFATSDPWNDSKGKPRRSASSYLASRTAGYTPEELAASGAFLPRDEGGFFPFFEKRIVFPYWSRGKVVYLIGRKTPWTPANRWEEPKYRKLPVHNPEKRPFVSPVIDNSHLFNEDALLGRPERVVITEGITDCISLLERGFSAITPATVRIAKHDWRKLVPKLKGVQRVFICQDNEVSNAGLIGALDTARLLAQEGIDARVAVLPLGEKQAAARQQLRERFGLTDDQLRNELPVSLSNEPAETQKERAELLANAKIDVNEYFASGRTAADFEQLLSQARSPIQFSIERIPPELPEEEREAILAPILKSVANEGALEQERLLRAIQERFGKSQLPLGALRKALRAAERKIEDQKREHEFSEGLSQEAAPGSCREAVDRAIAAMLKDGEDSVDYSEVAAAAFDWFRRHGAAFFKTPEGKPFFFFEQTLYWSDSLDHARFRAFSSFIQRHTGILLNVGVGRTFQEAFANLSFENGETREQFSWSHTDVENRTVFFSLNNPEREIVRISPSGIEVLRNGDNPGRVILDGAPKMSPIRYLPEADVSEANRLLKELILDNLTCQESDAPLILAWFSCFLLLDFVGTRPMARFEGATQSGKTTAVKLLSTLLYGQPEQKKSTDAANYTDGSKNPLIVLDNIEAKQMTDELTTFILTSITGIAKEKRKGGSDTENVIERTKCLLATTGIEPIGAELAEVLSRSLVFRFALGPAASDCFLEADVLTTIRKNRDLILSALFKKTSAVLGMIQAGAHVQVMKLIHRALGNHEKRRTNDYLALMYLMNLVGMEQADIDGFLTELAPGFARVIQSLNAVTSETARESNPTATILSALFRAHEIAKAVDRDSSGVPARSARADFLARYQLAFSDSGAIEGALARDLFIALTRCSRDYGLSFPVKSGQQFYQRFANDLRTIEANGFEILILTGRQRERRYSIRRVQAGSLGEEAA